MANRHEIHQANALLEAARAREPEPKRIDYDRMNREFPKQKAALTRAVNSGDPAKVVLTCKKTVQAWDEIGAWPDDWARWQRALDDILGFGNSVDLQNL